ncbi:unnamed protein product [Amoebophrya sp. A25]|nr:unnamed protein product [Amoebophrya sp. A25]|eukprot:GSA25T00003670001.1
MVSLKQPPTEAKSSYNMPVVVGVTVPVGDQHAANFQSPVKHGGRDVTPALQHQLQPMPIQTPAAAAMKPAADERSENKQDRPQWTSRYDFIFVLMGYAIGIGNLWRFPYLCGKHGGGAFLFVYLFCLAFCAFPLFLLELVIGQNYQSGPVECYRRLHPKFEGLAYIAAYMNTWVLSYYQMVIAWGLVFFVRSFGWFSDVPWADTDTKEYFEKKVLDRADSFNAHGAYHWSAPAHLLLAVVASWVITYLCLVRGIHSAGRVAYFTVITPFVLIFVLLCKTAALEGAGSGIVYYLKPRLEYVFDPATWSAACGQILFSLSPGTGAATALASYNKRDYPHLFQDALAISLTNSGFSILSGFVVFSVVGNLAHSEGLSVDAVAQEGAGLTFVVFPKALASMPTIFSWFFFFTLVLLGLDSSFAWVQTLITYIMDYYAGVSGVGSGGGAVVSGGGGGGAEQVSGSGGGGGGGEQVSGSGSEAQVLPSGSDTKTSRLDPPARLENVVTGTSTNRSTAASALPAAATAPVTERTGQPQPEELHPEFPSQSQLRQRVTLILCATLGLTSLVYATRNGVHILEVVDHYCPTYCLLFSAFLEFVLFGYVVGPERTRALVLELCGPPDRTATHDENSSSTERSTSSSTPLQRFVLRFLTKNKRTFDLCLRFVGPLLSGGVLLVSFVSDCFFREYHSLVLELFGWAIALLPIVAFCFHAYFCDQNSEGPLKENASPIKGVVLTKSNAGV